MLKFVIFLGIMRVMVRSIPEGHHTVTPYLSLQNAAKALDFNARVFGAIELMRIPGPGGTVGHTEIKIGDSLIMLADEYPEMEFLSPRSRGGTTVHIHLYVKPARRQSANTVWRETCFLKLFSAHPHVTWDRTAQPNLVKLVWQESGGPGVDPPKKRHLAATKLMSAFDHA
jgi:hypothetical protein